MATSVSNYEVTYGPIADSYAAKYGVPVDTFRQYIGSLSGFDPLYSGTKGNGIAATVNNSSNLLVNSFDPAQSLDFAAQKIAADYKDTGSWTDAFKLNGFVTSTDTNDLGSVDAMGNPTGVTNGDNTAVQNAAKDNAGGVDGILGSVKTFLTKYAYSGIILVSGLLLILATLYVVVTRGTGEK